ncbi:lipopolysaccharide heptosyltransferase II [candidate division KSB1 bacterium]
MKVVIIQTAFIGDVILCTSMIEALKAAGHEISVTVKPEAAALFVNDDRLQNIHVFDKRGADKGLTGILAMGRNFEKSGYDAAVIPHRSLRSALIAWLGKIPCRIGFHRSAGRFLMTDVIGYNKSIHEVKRNHSLLGPLGVTSPEPAPCVRVTDEDRFAVREWFKKWNIEESDVLVGIGPGSQWFTKQWGIERYRKLLELYAEKKHGKVLCFGGPDERQLCESICSAASLYSVNTAGIFSLKQSAAALEKMRVVVTNDNGLMHLAGAVNTPVIAIFGPTIPGFGFAPWGDRHTVIERELYCRPCSIHGTKSCPEGHFRCMREISPESLMQTVEDYIDKPA